MPSPFPRAPASPQNSLSGVQQGKLPPYFSNGIALARYIWQPGTVQYPLKVSVFLSRETIMDAAKHVIHLQVFKLNALVGS